MSIFIFLGYVCLHFVSGARPSREWTHVSDQLELDHEQRLAEGKQTTAECPELKDQLEKLGIRGEGNPCGWEGIGCSFSCTVSSIVREDAVGDLIDVEQFRGLHTLELSNAKVAGDLRHLEKLKNLTRLSLSNTLVAGYLKSLKSLMELKMLDLSSTKVGGGLNDLKRLGSLKMLNLSNIAVTGGLKPLRSLRKLEVLDLGRTRVSDRSRWLKRVEEAAGIQALAKLTMLQHLDLSNTNLGGDLKSLQYLEKLQMLELNKTKVSGELKELQNMTEIRKVGLRDTQVKGTLADIQYLMNLQQLVLDNTMVGGDLDSLSRLAELEEICLDRTKVKGDIAVFRGLEKLRVLWLLQTQVHGHVSALGNLNSLQQLDLGFTSVKGSLTFVQNLTALCRLSFGGTRVAGDLTSLENLTSLQELRASATRVTGDLRSLRNLWDLRFLNLGHNNNVTGVLKDVQHLSKLKLFGVDKTKVHGDAAFLENLTGLEVLWLGSHASGQIAFLRKMTGLQKLSMPGSHIKGDLQALENLTKLHRVRLSNTMLTGGIKALKRLTGIKFLWLQNTEVTGDLDALSSMTGLSVLDLSNTSVAGDFSFLHGFRDLEHLFLGKTNVTGDVNLITELKALRVARLEGTGVSGTIKLSAWRGCCQQLEELNLADSQAGPLEPFDFVPEVSATQKPLLLPALDILNVSGCPINDSMEDFLRQFAVSRISLLLASGCGLTGAVPDIGAMKAKVDGEYKPTWRSSLKQALQILDVSSNNLTLVEAIPAAVRLDLRNNRAPITLSPAVFAAAAQHVALMLQNTKLANPEQLKPLLSDELRLKESYTTVKDNFACRDPVDPMLQITPELFMPKQMCACSKGYNGSGTACHPCLENTYTDEMNSPDCHRCPKNSTALKASTSWTACKCAVGEINQAEDGTLSCQCPRGEALVDVQPGSEHCEPCPDLKLHCEKPGTNASTALVLNGHARLRNGSYKVYKCLDVSRCKPSECAEGYMGRLCSDCQPGHHESRGECKPCTDLQSISATKMVLLALCGAGALALLGAAAWSIRRRLADADLRLKCAVGLLVPQLFALLQLVQLWCVLARLAQPPDDVDGSGFNVTASVEAAKSDTWESYLEILQLSAEELQGLVALQCLFNGATVRLFFAVATPLLPLALLFLCCFIELFIVGAGIRIGLKLLTVLFIGGASGAARLLECQQVDGTGKVPLDDSDAFRRLVPHLLCTEETWVDFVGKACGLFYGVVIPLFLALLFAKQHLVMRQTKTFVAQYKGTPQKVTLQLQMVSEVDAFQEDGKRKRLMAAAAVFVALHVRGRAVVSFTKDGEAVIVDQIQTEPVEGRASAEFHTDFSVDLLVGQPKEAALLRSRGEIMRYNAMVQMLTERSILDDIQLDRSDRIMLGAKQLLCKYGSCQFVWMEICVKVASSALVSVVAVEREGLWLAVAIMLGMALVVGTTRPFVRPQENMLQTFCFACLAVAAVGFHELHTWLPRVALLLPVLLLVASLARPDSQEALAMRLYEELEAKLPDGPVEVSTERLQFI